MEFFRKHYIKIGWIIAILNIAIIIYSTRSFLIKLNFPVMAWLLLNACTPSVIIFLIGFFTGKRSIMALSLPFLFFFGSIGLFMFGWSDRVMIAQIGHILMICALIYSISVITYEKFWKKSIIGLILGILLLAAALPFQQKFIKEHPEYIKRLGDPGFEKMLQKN